MGTRSKALRSAKWRPMYHKLNGDGHRAYDPNVVTAAHVPLTGDIDTRPREDSLIILPNIGFNEHMQVNRDTLLILLSYPQKHHVHGRTWH